MDRLAETPLPSATEQAGPQAVDRRPAVLHIITDLDVGGAERMLVNYLTARAARGPAGDVVVSLKGHGSMADSLVACGVPIVPLDLPLPSPGRFPVLAWRTLCGLLRVARLIRRMQPHAVVGWMYHGNVFADWSLALSGRRGATRFVAGIRCSVMQSDRYGPVHRWMVRCCRRMSGRVDVLAYNSEAGRREHEAIGFSPAHAVVASNGVDTGVFHPDEAARAAVRAELGISPDAAVAILAARVDPMKDFDTLLAAFEAITPRVHLILVGAGTEALAARPQLHRLGVRSDMPRLYSAADMIVMASAFGEGFPNVVAEGMACGLVPVVTDVGDAAVIAGDAGVVVAPSSADALACAIESIAGLDEGALAIRKKAARTRIEELFSIDAAVQRLNDAILGGEATRAL